MATRVFAQTVMLVASACAQPVLAVHSLVVQAIQSVNTPAPSALPVSKIRMASRQRASIWVMMLVTRFLRSRAVLVPTCSAAKSPKKTKNHHANRFQKNGCQQKLTWNKRCACCPCLAKSVHTPKMASWFGPTLVAMVHTLSTLKALRIVAAPMPTLKTSNPSLALV